MLISTWNQNLRELSSLVVGSVNCVAPSTPSRSLECESLGVEMNIWREKTFDKSFMDESCLLGRWRILRKKMESFLCAQWLWKGASLKALERLKLDDSTHSSHIFCRKKEETSCNDIFVIEESNELKHAAHAGCIEPRYERQKAFYNPKTMKENTKLWQISMLAQIELWWKIVVEWNDIEKTHRPETHKKRFDKAEKNVCWEL